MAANATATIERKKDGEWAEWTIGGASFAAHVGGLTRVVSGRDGENLIRDEEATQDGAWGRAGKGVGEAWLWMER